MNRYKGSKILMATLLLLLSAAVVFSLSPGPAVAQDVFTGNPIAKIVKETAKTSCATANSSHRAHCATFSAIALSASPRTCP